jgi:large subunit ribosomal protein L17
MRHQKKKVTLDRNTAARRSLLANLAESLILHEKIKTTKAKAKAVRSLVERLVTKAKKNDLAARRQLKRVLYTDNAVDKTMEVLGPRYLERKGGYTRITLLGVRKGDAGEEAMVEFV